MDGGSACSSDNIFRTGYAGGGKLAKPEIKKVTSESAGKLKVLYKKVPKQAKAQVQVSTDKKFKKNVRSKVARGTVKSITFKKLKAVTYYVRVCKVKAYRDDKLYDVIYIATKPYDAQENYLDEEYYAQARHKVEAKIWTEDMTVLQKLNALAGYIRTTTHYPGSGSTKKETNPTFWNAFAVDGIQLYYYMYTMPMSTVHISIH